MLNKNLLLRCIKHIMENITIRNSFNLSHEDIKLLNNYVQDSTTPDNVTYCDQCDLAFQDLALQYSEFYHGYIAIFVCVFGIVANSLTIAVLTRKDMACAPINRILTGIAIVDMLLMMEYTSFAYYYYIELPGKLNFPYWGAAFILFHTHFTQVLHTISISLTLALAIWRYIAIGYPEKNHIYCSEKKCTLAILLSYFLPIFLCSPTYFIFQVKSTTILEDKEYILYHTSLSDMAVVNEQFLVFNFWMYAVVIKLLPCCILTVISFWLIQTLFKAKRRKQILKGYATCSVPTVTIDKDLSNYTKKKSKAERRADRTTRMLVAVMLLFLITEFPQGLFALYIGMKGKCVFLMCYQKFGEIMDIFALLNGAINFILYCCMNRMFRATFGQLFKNRILYKWSAASQSEIQTTINTIRTNTTDVILNFHE